MHEIVFYFAFHFTNLIAFPPDFKRSEGRWGKSVGEIAALVATSFSDAAAFPPSVPIDFALILTGANDILNIQDGALILMKYAEIFLEKLIHSIWNRSPNATILLGTVAPETFFASGIKNQCWLDLNSRYRSLVLQLQSEHRIRFVYIYFVSF